MECPIVRKLRFVRPWRSYRVGQVVEVPGGIAGELLAKRVAVEDTQGTLIETAAVEPEVRTAAVTRKRKAKP